MFSKKTKSTTDSSNALARPDPNVKTSSAQTETTNTTLWNATTFNTERNTVTLTTTRQTVTHQQNVRTTEKITRLEPTFDEIQELLRKMNINASDLSKRRSGNFSANFGNSNTGAGGVNNNNSSSLSAKSTPKFKSTASTTKRLSGSYDSYGVRGAHGTQNARTSNTSSSTSANKTLGYIQETNVTQKDGRKITATTETQAVKLNRVPPIFNLSSPNSPLSTNYKPETNKTAKTFATPSTTTKVPSFSSTALSRTGLRTDAQLIKAPATTKPPTTGHTSSSYTSPYSNRFISVAGPTSNAPVIATTTTTGLNNRSTLLYTLPPLTSVRPTNSNTSSPITSTNENSVIKKTRKLQPGRCYILNHVKFDDKELAERVGSEADVSRLKETLNQFKLNVEIIKNATVADIKKLSKTFKTKDYSRNSCLVVIIMSHGSRYDRLSARDGTYTLDDDIVFPMLQNNTMMDKPKIFIVQACKGNMKVGTENDRQHSDSHPLGGDPTEILKCYSTYEGFLSYRTEEGTTFIQTFCEYLKKNGTNKNIKDIMDDVIREVKNRSDKTQIPTITTTMTKPYVFGEYI